MHFWAEIDMRVLIGRSTRILFALVLGETGFWSAESGQDVVEYGLIIATIAVVVLIGTLAFGNQIGPWFASLATRITTHT